MYILLAYEVQTIQTLAQVILLKVCFNKQPFPGIGGVMALEEVNI